MRRLALTLVPLLLFACSRETAAPDAARVPTFSAASDWTEESIDLPAGDAWSYASCIDDWMDEVGGLRLRYHFVDTPSGWLVYWKQSSEGYYNVGVRTGNWYLAAPLAGAAVQRASLANDGFKFVYNIDPAILVNEGSGTRINWPLRVTVTVNANGELKVERFANPCNTIGK